MYNIVICTCVFLMCSITAIYLPPVMSSGIHSLNCGLLMSLFFLIKERVVISELCQIFWGHPVVAVVFVWAAVVSTPPIFVQCTFTRMSKGCLISSHPSSYSAFSCFHLWA